MKDIRLIMLFEDVDDDVSPSDLCDFINGTMDDVPWYILEEEMDMHDVDYCIVFPVGSEL